MALPWRQSPARLTQFLKDGGSPCSKGEPCCLMLGTDMHLNGWRLFSKLVTLYGRGLNDNKYPIVKPDPALQIVKPAPALHRILI